MTEFMRSSDAFTWSMESDARLRSTVVTVMLLDREPDWDEVQGRFEIISHKLPMFRQRVVESPPPAPPRWVDAPDFDLDYHMRRVTAPRPGTVGHSPGGWSGSRRWKASTALGRSGTRPSSTVSTTAGRQ